MTSALAHETAEFLDARDAPSARLIENPSASSLELREAPNTMNFQLQGPTEHEESKKIAKLPQLRPHVSRSSQPRYHVLQKWAGTVLAVESNFFTARLFSAGCDPEEAEIVVDEIPEEDRKLLAPGAIFYWVIGYLDQLSGQRLRISEIRFQRIPGWTQKELSAIDRRVHQLDDIFK